MLAFNSAAGPVQRTTSINFSLLSYRATRRPMLALFARHLASVASDAQAHENQSLALKSTARYNEIGVQQLSTHVFNQIFPNGSSPPPKDLVELSKNHLKRHNLLGKNTDNSAPIAFDLPQLQGRSLDQHFHRLGIDCAEPYLGFAKQFARANPPPKPRKWIHRPGWTKYYPDGRTKKVDFPDEPTLCFDTEVMWKESPYAVMACAASPTAWYAWLSPWLLGKTKKDKHLIPLGDPTQERLIVGHNIGFDRARVLEEYNIKQSRNFFMDTMSLHVAVNGMCSQQRPTWMKHKKNRELRERVASETPDHELAQLLSNKSMHEEEELWVERSSINSLRDVAKFHLDVNMDKAVRNDFGELSRTEIVEKLDILLDYCAADVAITHRVYQIVFPNFTNTCPHPVSFAALRHLSSVILPIDKTWDTYIANAEATYQKLNDAVLERLAALTKKAVELKDDPEKWQDDPWLKQLDWSGQEIRMVKGKKKDDPPRPAARQKKPGFPQWYKDLFPKTDSPLTVTVRTRIAPLLLRLAWDGSPLFWSDKFGWTFQTDPCNREKYLGKQMVQCQFDQADPKLRDDADHIYFKLPHKDGPTARCANPMAKGYLTYFENGILSSEFSYAKGALEMNASCSYWISARDRITSQMVVKNKDLPLANRPKSKSNSNSNSADEPGFILPQIIPMGTITRRAVENTWLTASNAKKNRVGSELKAMVKAPEGYSFVGADVDSQELWIASLIGDATFKLHGGNAVGFMTLEGTKSAGTDLHSRTASILGISRNDAKIFNYGRIYGAGLRFAATLLRQFNPGLSEQQTMDTASKLYASTKGTKTARKNLYKRPFWRGGTESFVFNKLEEFAEQDKARTPVLGAGITEALMMRFVNKGGYLTSRINWAIQSSGVDYLHLLIVAMDYLARRFNIDARLAITVHDEIRYLVRNQDKYRAAMALQVANVWTRATFAQQVGIDDLPQSCAYFSAIDIDHVLRKEVDMDCVTPSHPEAIAPGESLDICSLLAKGEAARLDPSIVPANEGVLAVSEIEYTPRVPVMRAIQEASGDSMAFIKAQIAKDDEELREILKKMRSKDDGATGGSGGRSGSSSSSNSKEKTISRRGLKSVLPYRAHPQLVPMEEPISVAEAMGSSNNGNRQNGMKSKWPWSKYTSKGSRSSWRI